MEGEEEQTGGKRTVREEREREKEQLDSGRARISERWNSQAESGMEGGNRRVAREKSNGRIGEGNEEGKRNKEIR